MSTVNLIIGLIFASKYPSALQKVTRQARNQPYTI
jgi:hypothetical protein